MAWRFERFALLMGHKKNPWDFLSKRRFGKTLLQTRKLTDIPWAFLLSRVVSWKFADFRLLEKQKRFISICYIINYLLCWYVLFGLMRAKIGKLWKMLNKKVQNLIDNWHWKARGWLILRKKWKKEWKRVASNIICCTFAMSEMTNPVFSAWGKPSPTLPKLNRVANGNSCLFKVVLHKQSIERLALRQFSRNGNALASFENEHFYCVLILLKIMLYAKCQQARFVIDH